MLIQSICGYLFCFKSPCQNLYGIVFSFPRVQQLSSDAGVSAFELLVEEPCEGRSWKIWESLVKVCSNSSSLERNQFFGQHPIKRKVDVVCLGGELHQLLTPYPPVDLIFWVPRFADIDHPTKLETHCFFVDVSFLLIPCFQDFNMCRDQCCFQFVWSDWSKRKDNYPQSFWYSGCEHVSSIFVLCFVFDTLLLGSGSIHFLCFKP